MGVPDLGPAWMWKLLGIMALVGIAATAIGAVAGIWWMIKHIQFV